ncbi:MAG: ORF6N domain-containing protein [Bacteroidales bacterium]|nr:ORF6N domain-containing protein [Bacteroidales bacterium]
MNNETILSTAQQTENIKKAIYEIRGQKVMLDDDLAYIYGVKTKALNQAVKRNLGRFPTDFMFRLSEKEWTEINNNILITSMRSQFVTASAKRRNKSNPPYAFTGHRCNCTTTQSHRIQDNVKLFHFLLQTP